MLQIGQIRCCQELLELEKLYRPGTTPHNVFYGNFLSKRRTLVSEQDLEMSKNVNFLLLFSLSFIGETQPSRLNQYS